jgi:hypothetical protein
VSGLGLLAGIVMGMPAVLTNPAGIAKTVSGIAGFYDVLSSDVGYFKAALSSQELGVPLMVIGIAGMVWLFLHNRTSRALALSSFGFGVLLLSALIWSRFQPLRNVLSLVPLICIASAFFLTRLDVFVRGWLGLALALLVAVSLAIPSWRFVRKQRHLVDSRVAAITWLQKHARPDTRILALEELAILPREWKRLPAQPTLVSWFDAPAALARGSFDYLLTSDFDLQFARDPKRWAEQRDRWSALTSRMPQRAAFGHVACPVFAGVWRTNDERIVIVKPNAAASPNE